MQTCRDIISFTSKEKLEMTADVVASLVFQISKNKLPKEISLSVFKKDFILPINQNVQKEPAS